MPTVKELTEQVERQQALIERMTTQLAGLSALMGIPEDRQLLSPEERDDYIKHGSDKHAVLLGLVPTDEDDPHGLDKWKLVDRTAYGPNARPEYLAEVLRQKVSSLTSPVPTPQSADRRAPHYAPPIWRPADLPAPTG